MLREGPEIKALAETHEVRAPVLAVGAGAGPFTDTTMSQAVSSTRVTSAALDGVGHSAAMVAPEKVANAIIDFVAGVDST